MVLTSHVRKWLFFGGLAVIMFTVVMDGTFATDAGGPTPVPEPSVLALVGIGGAVAILVSLFRGPRK